MKKAAALIALVLIAAVAGYVVYAMYYSDEARIKQTVRGSAQALNQRDVPRLMSYISEGYRDDFGHRSREALEQNAAARVSDFEPGSITVGSFRIEIGEEAAGAKVRLIAHATMVRPNAIESHFLQSGVPIELQLKKQPGGWRIVTVRQAKYTIN